MQLASYSDLFEEFNGFYASYFPSRNIFRAKDNSYGEGVLREYEENRHKIAFFRSLAADTSERPPEQQQPSTSLLYQWKRQAEQMVDAKIATARQNTVESDLSSDDDDQENADPTE